MAHARLALFWQCEKTADEVRESEKTFSQLNYELGEASLGGTRTHTSRFTVDVLQLGSQSWIGGDEAKGTVTSEAGSVKSVVFTLLTSIM